MKHMPLIKSVMTPFPYSIETERSLDDARAMMNRHNVHHLPVMQNGRLIGVISDRDVRAGGTRGSEDDPPGDPPLIRDVCDARAYVVALNTPLDQVLLHMARTHTDAALVTKEDRLVGIFTMTDACRAYGELLRSKFSPNGGNDAA